MIFLKIITFPIRLVLFLVIALISGIMFALNNTIGVVCCVASELIQKIGVGLMTLGIASYVITFIIDYERMSENVSLRDTVIFGVLLLIIMAVFYFLPVIAQVIFAWVQVAAIWLWEIAKKILLLK